MRIIHTSDWHLGQHFYGKSRANEHKKFLYWLLEQIKVHNIDAVIVAGDIFDTGTPPSYAREMYFDFIVNIHQLNCQLVVLAGNHDSVAMLSESKQLLASLSTQVIANVTDASESKIISQQVFPLFDHQGQAQAIICAIPFIRPRDVIKSQAGQSASEKQQSLQQAISDHYQHLYDHALLLSTELLSNKQLSKETLSTDRAVDSIKVQRLPIIATGHLTTIGASVSDSVRDIYIGSLDAFPANAFPKFDYIALGHIHRPQKVLKSGHIRYCGSPIPLSFDELKQDKQIVMLEFISNNNQTTVPKITEIKVPRFQAMAMIKSSVENLAKDIKSEVEQQFGLELNDMNQNEGQPKKLEERVWCDIEIESAGYLQDLTARINQIIEDLPVEVLLVRRSKKSRELMPASQKKITLNELTLEDVFETRMAQENWQTEDEIARKKRMSILFKQVIEQVKSSTPESDEASA